ncbi:MAG: protease [Cyanothece sp. SIO1E1]|nr:protease [Cyanothece sp. SIO1E1]
MNSTPLFQSIQVFLFGEHQINTSGLHAYMQGKAVVESDIEPGKSGRVKFQATYWFGCCAQDVRLPRGATVHVVGRKGNTLLVQPESYMSSAA